MALNPAKKVIYAAMAANILIAATKFGAAWFTGSSAMISERVHSVVDTGDQVLLLYGLKRAAIPPDEEFPFGHGKELYFWSFVVSILIFALGAGISLYEGILHLLQPKEMTSVTANYVVLAAAIIFETISWVISVREFGKEKGRLATSRRSTAGKTPPCFSSSSRIPRRSLDSVSHWQESSWRRRPAIRSTMAAHPSSSA